MRFFILFLPLVKKPLREEAETSHKACEGNMHLITDADGVCSK